jgi:hypothetical protein
LQCKNPASNSPNNSNGNINKISPYQIMTQNLSTNNENGSSSNKSTSGIRKFSVTKMLGSLIGKHNNATNNTQQVNTGTVVVCQRSDLYRNKVLQRRQNFMAAVSL